MSNVWGIEEVWWLVNEINWIILKLYLLFELRENFKDWIMFWIFDWFDRELGKFYGVEVKRESG